MDKAWQLVPLFATGFLISRMVARTGLAESAVQALLRQCHGHFGQVLLRLLMVTILLSLFIPNMLTVLALLPIVEQLGHSLKESHEPANQRLLTPLILALIYGANIGGMGSLVGSPANAMMLGFLEYANVPARQQLNFLSWLVWGLPLVVIFGLLAWGLLMAFLGPTRLWSFALALPVHDPPRPDDRRRQQHAARISLYSAAFWLSLSFLTSLFPSQKVLWDGLAVLFGISFTWFVFRWKLPGDKQQRTLLQLSDCYTGLPWRGVGMAAGAVGLSLLLFYLGLPTYLAAQVKTILPSSVSPFWLYLALTLITIFSTELISNTAASVALFPIAYGLAIELGWHPLPAVMGVALASTCAFMSPLATPATGLAFGGMQGVSLKKMLWLGFFVNLIGGAWLALLLTYILPAFYGFPLILPR
jgi:sodium-dependent dicarboxylate transporter 2/3/5